MAASADLPPRAQDVVSSSFPHCQGSAFQPPAAVFSITAEPLGEEREKRKAQRNDSGVHHINQYSVNELEPLMQNFTSFGILGSSGTDFKYLSRAALKDSTEQPDLFRIPTGKLLKIFAPFMARLFDLIVLVE